jgi:hypothetical protein
MTWTAIPQSRHSPEGLHYASDLTDAQCALIRAVVAREAAGREDPRGGRRLLDGPCRSDRQPLAAPGQP